MSDPISSAPPTDGPALPTGTAAAGETVTIRTLDNGLTLLVETVPSVRSAAMALLLPGGCIYEPDGLGGTANILSDLITSGAGERDSRTLSDELDGLGVQRSEAAGWSHLTLSAAMTADRLPTVLPIYADIARRPHLPADEYDPAADSVRQALQSTEDEPQRKLSIELRKRLYDAPWGRPPEGTLVDLPRVSHAAVARHYRTAVGPTEAILAVAGAVTFEQVAAQVEALWGDWPPHVLPIVRNGPRGPLRDHIEADSTQTHIGLAFDSVPYRADDFYAAWAATHILGGGSSSRLFTEVREHRGLCYSIYATTGSTLNAGRVIVYAGTTSDRAQETLDLTLEQIRRLPESITDDELRRCKAQAKSSMVMQQESTSARAMGLAKDWRHLGEYRPLEDVAARIDALTVDDLRDHLDRHGQQNLTLLTLGPEPLTMPAAAGRSGSRLGGR